MATLLDVENALVAKIAASKPAAYNVSYAVGQMYPQKLEDDLKTNKYWATVFPHPSGSKRVPMYLNKEPEFVQPGVDPDTSVIVTEVSRQVRIFQIHIWTNDVVARDVIGEAVKLALDDIEFLDFPDGTRGRVQNSPGELEEDLGEKFNVYHRMYLYSVNYVTARTETVADACIPRILNIEAEIVDIDTEKSVLVNEIL